MRFARYLALLVIVAGCGARIRTFDSGLIAIDAPADRSVTIVMPEDNRAVICAGLTTRVVFNRTRSGSASGSYSGIGAALSGATGDTAQELAGNTETTRILEIALSWICQQAAAKQLGQARVERMFLAVIQAAVSQETRRTAEAVASTSPKQADTLKEILAPPPAVPEPAAVPGEQ